MVVRVGGGHCHWPGHQVAFLQEMCLHLDAFLAAWEMKLYQEGERRALWTWGDASALGKGSDGPGSQR